MGYERTVGESFRVVSTRPEYFEQLEALQRVVFPTLSGDELFRAEHYRKHVELFAEGQFVVVSQTSEGVDRVAGMTSTIRYDFDFDHPQHTFLDVSQQGWLTSHEPAGRWLYGMDIGVDPEFRGRGLARALYAARHDVARRLGLAGQVTVGLLHGYGAVADELSPQAYFDDLVRGRRTDPTVSAQQRVGFELRCVVEGYVDDPQCGGCGVLMTLPAEQDVPWPTR